MEKKKTTNQNPEIVHNPEENTEAAANKALEQNAEMQNEIEEEPKTEESTETEQSENEESVPAEEQPAVEEGEDPKTEEEDHPEVLSSAEDEKPTENGSNETNDDNAEPEPTTGARAIAEEPSTDDELEADSTADAKNQDEVEERPGDADKVAEEEKAEVLSDKNDDVPDHTAEDVEENEKVVEEEVVVEEVAEEEVAEEEDTEDKEEGHEEEEKEEEEDKKDEEDEVGDDDEEESESYDELSAQELVSRLEDLVQSEDISKIKTKVALIKVAFMRLVKEMKQDALDNFVEEGGQKDDFNYEESKLEKRFNKAFDVYRKNKMKYNELQEKLKIENLEKKQNILEQLKELINSEESLKKTYDQFRALQAEWKDVGMVPSGEVSNLWQSYHFLVEKFFDKVKINKELRDLDMKKNLELKLELCEKTEELLLETSIIKSFKQLQKYHDEWKEIGPVPQEQNDEIWERFKSATDKINERRREHYGQLQEDQEKNLLAKTDLCEKAEELLAVTPENFKGWQQQTKKMNELFKLWRSIGRAPKKQNTEIWERFKSSMNTFYDNKKEFMKTIKNEQLNNYNMKVDLCVEAESLKDSTDWKKTTQELIRLQKEWKNIGPVPRKHSDKIWKRFRSACDEFFNQKSEHFSSVHDREKDNLQKKFELIERIKNQTFTSNKSKDLNILKDFQREWLEIGFVPMKDKESVQKQFREAIDTRLEELKISSTELSNASYATRMEAVKDSPEADRVYRKEISFLNNKIVKLREDVNLWENNLGFFANSKKADILKQEFEQKIEKAKQELAGMEAKVKYLRKMATEA
ncbi:MAG: DUF349 domain-containing protein [Bacteroidales bacterium]|nr:DUF349 domain-containing protein [Bacteroidales bacterium]